MLATSPSPRTSTGPIPRDLWCETLGNRVNSAYRLGGPDRLLAALREHGLYPAVVASDVDGIPEDVESGRSGLLVPPGDEEALARTLERVTRDADLRHRLAAAGRATFDRRFSADALTTALAHVYEEIRSGLRDGPPS
jgi:glycosyltransferase involved in cell wall biosynthesis